MNEKRCIITSMKKGIKEHPTLKKYLDRMISDGIDEDDEGISYLVSDGKILIEVHDKKECAIKLKEILDNEW